MPMQAHLQWGPGEVVEKRGTGISGVGSVMFPPLHPKKKKKVVMVHCCCRADFTTVKSPLQPKIKKREQNTYI